MDEDTRSHREDQTSRVLGDTWQKWARNNIRDHPFPFLETLFLIGINS